MKFGVHGTSRAVEVSVPGLDKSSHRDMFRHTAQAKLEQRIRAIYETRVR